MGEGRVGEGRARERVSGRARERERECVCERERGGERGEEVKRQVDVILHM